MISVIIPLYNNHDMTFDCIQAVREHTKELYEFILIDNGSTPAYVPPYVGSVDITLIRNEENKGFPVAVNQGMEIAKGDKILLLNNDVIVTPGAIDRLAAWLDEFSIIGPTTNYCMGVQNVVIPVYNNREELDKEALKIAEDKEGIYEEVNWVIGFCMGFRKSLFDEIGKFDESLWPCSGEEIEFCLNARKAGHKIGVAFDTYVYHYGSQTFQALEKEDKLNYEDICNRNNKHLEEKWGKEIWENQLVLERVSSTGDEIKLNLGCGFAKIDGYINIDKQAEVNPDLVCDILNGLPYKDNSIDVVRAHDFLEHIPLGRTIEVITEIWRVLKHNGLFESFTPDAQFGQAAFQDPTHVSFWVENSWLYYSHKTYRGYYGIKANFKITSNTRIQLDESTFHRHVFAKAIKEET